MLGLTHLHRSSEVFEIKNSLCGKKSSFIWCSNNWHKVICGSSLNTDLKILGSKCPNQDLNGMGSPGKEAPLVEWKNRGQCWHCLPRSGYSFLQPLPLRPPVFYMFPASGDLSGNRAGIPLTISLVIIQSPKFTWLPLVIWFSPPPPLFYEYTCFLN